MKAWKYSLCLAALASCAVTHALGAGLTISPQVITNDYIGKITLTITGLAVGKTVAVEKYIDFNANGIIDAATEWPVQSFLISDGRVAMIGGVRNSSVPG